MSVRRSSDDSALRAHPSFDLPSAMGAAQKAAASAFEAAGMPRPQVVVNVAWSEHGVVYAAGSFIPARAPKFLAESLRASAEEVDES